ncbi:MAG: two-component regulator propeller domain-containing protein [Saprospiraceae bacterium]
MMRAIASLLFSTLFLSLIGQVTEVPKILQFSKKEYLAQNQNWDIAQGKDHLMYFANTGGLLMYDGVRWVLEKLPHKQVIRSVFCSTDGRIYTGAYGAAGYWEKGNKNRLKYTSLLDTIPVEQASTEEYWHIVQVGKAVIFQSFSLIIVFDGEKTRAIKPPGNTMFAQLVGNQLILPTIYDGLFYFSPNGSFNKISGSEIFSGKRVASILPAQQGGFLVCTQNSGIYAFQDGHFTQWKSRVNEELEKWQLNKAIQMANGDYVFGTILNGIFVTDRTGTIRYHINKENGLQNNTVLSLFEDEANNLWVGMDKGIDLVAMNSPLIFYQDKSGEIGTVYAALLFEHRLYIGSNQGLFYKPFPPAAHETFTLVNGTQGQVWQLKAFDNQLIGGHNAGTFCIKNGQPAFLTTRTGSYCSVAHPTQNNLLLQGTYTGIIVLEKNAKGEWAFRNELAGYNQPARSLCFDAQGHLWVKQPRNNLTMLTLDKDARQVSGLKAFENGEDFHSKLYLELLKFGPDFFIQADSLFLQLDPTSETLRFAKLPDNIHQQPANFKLVPGKAGEWFKVFPNKVVFIQEDKATELYVTLPFDNEQIIPLNDSIYLFCEEEGYGLFNTRLTGQYPARVLTDPFITAVFIHGDSSLLQNGGNGGKLMILQPWENNLKFNFTQPLYLRQPDLRYRLSGFDEKWSPFGNIYEKEYTNLPPGKYAFEVEAQDSGKSCSFDFVIRKRWYQALWLKIISVLLVLLFSRLLVKIHDHRLDMQKRKLQLEKERELQQQRIQARNERLQDEILNKNRKLADSTMELVRKNEMLQKIKDDLTKLESAKENERPVKAIRHLSHLIDSHINSDDDWKVFESNFNLLHDQFFKRLKETYPHLTPGDLRLAAYLKMNLSSKEIASLLNISVRGIENKRYRLRTKMNLDKEVNLTEFLMEF